MTCLETTSSPFVTSSITYQTLSKSSLKSTKWSIPKWSTSKSTWKTSGYKPIKKWSKSDKNLMWILLESSLIRKLMIRKWLMLWTNKTVKLNCLTTMSWCWPMTWRNSRRYWVEPTNSSKNCKKLTKTFCLERRILIASVAAKWTITLTTFNKCKARTVIYIKKVERPELQVILAKIMNMMIHSQSIMVGLLRKRCHPKS